MALHGPQDTSFIDMLLKEIANCHGGLSPPEQHTMGRQQGGEMPFRDLY